MFASSVNDGISDDFRFQALMAWLKTCTPNHIQLDFNSPQAIPSDCGARRYFRMSAQIAFTPEIKTLIAVDAPPPEKTQEFIYIRYLLHQAGALVPHIYAADAASGLLLIEDFGNQLYLNTLQQSNDQDIQNLIENAITTLKKWQLLSNENALPTYDEILFQQELQLFIDWFLPHVGNASFVHSIVNQLQPTFDLLVQSARSQAKVVVHRDFMPRNLLVTPSYIRHSGPGVIDFQDAVNGPITYDLVSLLRDAFISWDECLEKEWIKQYWYQARASKLPVDHDMNEFQRQFDWMGIQRHLKILGLFIRLKVRDGKPHYYKDLPRFIKYVQRVSQKYSELQTLYKVIDQLSNQLV